MLEEIREEKVEDVKKVALAIWEADGKISVFLDTKYNALTPADYKMAIEPFDLPKLIIKDGKENSQELKQANKDEIWLVTNLASQYQTETRNVLLATLDNKNNLKFFYINEFQRSIEIQSCKLYLKASRKSSKLFSNSFPYLFDAFNNRCFLFQIDC